jgi:hypothetical protein
LDKFVTNQATIFTHFVNELARANSQAAREPNELISHLFFARFVNKPSQARSTNELDQDEPCRAELAWRPALITTQQEAKNLPTYKKKL